MTGPLGGPPVANTNSTKHGGRSRRPGLALGDWGSRFASLRAQVLRYRRRLVRAYEEAHGAMTTRGEELIMTAARSEMASRVCQRLLSTGGDKLSVSEQAALIKQITTYANERERAVRKLRLSDDKPPDAWAAVDRILSQEPQDVDSDDSGADGVDIASEGERPGDESVESQGGDDENGVDWSVVDDLPHPAFE